MVFFGIDPGQKGGIAFMSCYQGEWRFFDNSMEMPVSAHEIDVHRLYTVFMRLHREDTCFGLIEKAQAMPGQGVTSTFNYGKGYGRVLTVLEVTGLPYQEVRPQEWKKYYGLGPDKEKAAAAAIKLFPQSRELLYTPRGRLRDGLAEAMLIANYARVKWSGKTKKEGV